MSNRTGCTEMEARFAMRNPLCPERIGRQDYPDGCNLHEGICLKETGELCPTYQEYLNNQEQVK